MMPNADDEARLRAQLQRGSDVRDPEAAVYDRLRQYMTDAKAGRAKPTPWKRAPNPLLDFVEEKMGIRQPEAAPAKKDRPVRSWEQHKAIEQRAWDSLNEAEKHGVKIGNKPSEQHYADVIRQLLDEEEDEGE